jgi:glycosyltransferase involved in cell wall biosynthesis
MRVLMLLENRFPPDIRVEGEMAALLGAGHEVHLLCREDATDEIELPKTLRKLVVHSVTPKSELGGWRRRVPNLSLLWFHDGRWAREIRLLNRAVGPFDVLHVHDLPLVRTALRTGQNIGAEVVADLHENYPMALPFYTRGRSLSRLGRFLLDPHRWEKYEREAVPRCSAVIAVAEEMGSRLTSLGVRPDRITIVESYVDVERFLSSPADPTLQESFGDAYVITYVGGLGGSHDLQTAIRAMPKVVAAVPRALLVIVGDGKKRASLEDLVTELGIAEHVRFEGWVEFGRVPSYLAASDVCILPLVGGVQTDAGLANKLFQYMLAGKPLVATARAGTARIVEETNCGLLTPLGDSDAFADALIQLTDPEMRSRLGENGKRAVYDKYNWSRSASRLLGVYEDLRATA